MEAYLFDWANLLIRWLHVITAIAWVGSSFYFVFLDNNLIKPESPDLLEKGVGGAMWAVHGGGFYNPQKYLTAPKKVHTHLHWFYWESYTTWLTGFALFCVSYLWQAQTYMVDPNLVAWSQGEAVVVALAFLFGFWFVYDALCRTVGAKDGGDKWVGLFVFAAIVFASWLSTQLFAGRAAFLLMGAMIGTAMSANVFFWIIPGQRKMVKAMGLGEPVDPIHGKRGKQRSVHNTYFTLPVLFAMLSNHYSFTYTHEYNWLVLVVMMTAGALIRQFFVMRHGFKLGRNANPMPYALVGVALIVGLIVAMAPAPKAALSAAQQAQAELPVSYAQVKAVMDQRCVLCHGEAMQMKGVRLDNASDIATHAQGVYQQVVVTRAMPMNNSTGITDDERELVGRWFKAGAPTE
ncbi:urate hydroxylase PuuD [Comamonadaceae bacterium M7527]|nr:urate hydroxylase PuuD [Comamonadaceae bacterium M7527]